MGTINFIMPPEHGQTCKLYQMIQKISALDDVETIIEIGSSSGEGTTVAIAENIYNKDKRLFCVEAVKVRFEKLQEKYKDISNIYCYNGSSCKLNEFPTVEELTNEYNSRITYMNNYPLSQVLGWLQDDKDYIIEHKIEQGIIDRIKQEHFIDFFDLVIIDGSAFTGTADMKYVQGAKYYIFDDFFTQKNYNNHLKLMNDKNYECIMEDIKYMNGVSAFKKLK